VASSSLTRTGSGPNLSLQHDESVAVENVAGMEPSTATVEAVLTPSVTRALEECSDLGLVLAGDAAGELGRQDELVDVDGLAGNLQSWMEDAAGGVTDEPDLVSTELQHHLLDADELERQPDAVVTFADAFEEATGHSYAAA
jgi:hypothetical protein